MSPPTSLSPTDPKEQGIAIIGAGILGLTASIRLHKTFPNIPLTLISAELPSSGPANLSVDYTSAWAGAHYRPVPVPPTGNAQLSLEDRLARRTYEIRKQEASESSEAVTGIRFLEGVEYLDQPTDAHLVLRSGDGVYAGPGDGFQVLDPSELPEDVKWGCKYWTYDVNPDVYCAKLLRDFTDAGGKVVTTRLDSLEDAFSVVPDATTIVNCSGRGFNDPKVFITRGQTVLVKNHCAKTITRQNSDGTWTALIPRPGAGTIVGVSKEVRDMEAGARRETREAMLDRARRQFPAEILTQAGEEWDVVRDIVGRRPTREGGLRLEVENLGGKRVVHAYGVGGRGFELSWGVAEEVVRMVQGADGSGGQGVASRL